MISTIVMGYCHPDLSLPESFHSTPRPVKLQSLGSTCRIFGHPYLFLPRFTASFISTHALISKFSSLSGTFIICRPVILCHPSTHSQRTDDQAKPVPRCQDGLIPQLSGYMQRSFLNAMYYAVSHLMRVADLAKLFA